MKRRQFLKTAAYGLAGAATLRLGYAQTGSATLMVRSSMKGRVVPKSFTGLSYELAQLTEPEFFSAGHTDLIALFRRLSPHGLLRLGGNTSEFCWFQAEPTTPAPTLHVPPGDVAQNWMPHRLFAIEPQAIDALAGFLHATGWSVIYGLNFGNSTPERAAAEAAYAHRVLGSKLEFFQIGNEPDFYRDANNGTRPAGWGFDDYVREWVAYANAISERVPEARFGGPDTGASSDWVTRFGQQIAPQLGKRMVALSGHYYAEGPPDNPKVTTARLLAGDPKMATSTREIVAVADAHQLGYHMTEGNSCYRGGKPGMSNAFASSLWAGDYLLRLASLGCCGVNLHGGDSRFVSASLGDHNPGLESAGGRKVAAPNAFYTAIASEQGQHAAPRPVFYGMLLAQQFAGATMVTTELECSENVTAYAGLQGSRILVALFNKGDAGEVTIRLRAEKAVHKAEAWRLRGPALDATDGVTLGG
ncbi:MAG: hypothetical protein P4K80_05215, partial [Acidobacteriaceae bacterium]|nr:hypothetical protein [Acidobacteriaceae bacterium]